ncbi:unnamed protein product [Phytophthora fragariaefolia]|uniref:Unnamed protein product n=1 Tax=Phytophthora fragariaefolia TaxID=1490495 RepID=A0A9W7D3K0_9STRA|nr:unnamed protein product [Phytophthora fragariaefolia]
MTSATSGPVAAISSTAVTTVVSAAPTLDPAVVGGSSPCEFTAGSAISNSAATAPGSASPVQASVSTPAGSAVDVASRSVAVSTTPAANSAGLITSTSISAGVTASVLSVVATSVITSDSTVAPMPDPAESVMATSGSPVRLELTATPVTSSTSALDSADIAGLVSSSAEVPASTPSSAGAFVSAPDSAGVSATTPDSAGTSPSTAGSAAVSATAAGSAGTSLSAVDSAGVSATTQDSAVPAPPTSDSTVADVMTSGSVAPATSVPDAGVPAAPAVLRLLACPRGQSARQSHGDSVSGALTAGSGVSSTSTQSTVPTPGQGMVSPSGEGLAAQPLELSGDSSEGEPEGTVVSSPESVSGREQLGHRDRSVVYGPKARAPAASAPASDGDDSSQDSDNIPIRDIASRMQIGRKNPRGKYQSYLLLGRTPPPPSPPASEPTEAEAIRRPRSPLLGETSPQPERPTTELNSKRKHQHKHKHREPARVGHASSADDRDSSKKRKRSSAPPTRPGSPVAVATRISDPHPGAHPVPALSAVLRVPFSTLQTRSAQAASRDSRITPQNARLHELRFLHFGSTRCWKAILERQTGQIAQVGEGRPRIPPTPCSLAGLRAFADVYNPRHPAQWLRKLLPADPVFCSPLAFAQARTRLANSARASTLMEKLAEVWIKLRGEIPNSADSGNSASLARDDHPTRYFVALWERTHWIVESSVMMELHPSQQASSSYEEIAEMYAKWSKYKLNRKRRSDALRGRMTTISDNLFSAVMKVVDGVPAPDVDAEVYFEPSVPVYPLVNLSWIPGGADWSQAATEVDAVEPWRTWWLTDPASHPYNTCFRARNVDFLPFAPTGVESHVVEAAVVDDVDLTESDPPIRSSSAPLCVNRSGIHIFEGCGPGELGWSASDSVATARHA